MEDHTARGSGLAHIHYIVILRVNGGVWHTGPGSIPGMTMVESKRAPVRLRPPPTGYLEDDDNLKKEGVKC